MVSIESSGSSCGLFRVFFNFLRIEPSVGDPSGLDSYAVSLLVTLLPWQFHVTSLTEANRSITANSSLITKIFFPRWVLPTSAVPSSLFDLDRRNVCSLVLIALWEGHIAFQWIPVGCSYDSPTAFHNRACVDNQCRQCLFP